MQGGSGTGCLWTQSPPVSKNVNTHTHAHTHIKQCYVTPVGVLSSLYIRRISNVRWSGRCAPAAVLQTHHVIFVYQSHNATGVERGVKEEGGLRETPFHSSHTSAQVHTHTKHMVSLWLQDMSDYVILKARKVDWLSAIWYEAAHMVNFAFTHFFCIFALSDSSYIHMGEKSGLSVKNE